MSARLGTGSENETGALPQVSRHPLGRLEMETAIKLMRLTLVLSASILGCRANHSDPSVLTALNRLVCVEARSQEGLWAPPYGEIVVFDIDSKRRFYVTDDGFLDEYPTWSDDGKRILFRTCREGSDLSLVVQGLGAPAQLYSFDCISKKLQRIGMSLEKRFPKQMQEYYTLAARNDSASLLFTHWSNTLYEVLPLEDTVRTVKVFEQFEGILEMDCSPNGNLVSMKLVTPESQIGVYDIAADSLVLIPNTGPPTILGGWSPDGERLLVADSTMREYDCAAETVTQIPVDLTDIQLSTCAYTIHCDIVLLARIGRRNTIGPKEIGIIRNGSHIIEWLTDDHREKAYLTVHLPRIQ